MANIGIVIATDSKTATVEKSKLSKCDTCSKKNRIGACDTCLDREEQASERYVADNSIGAKVGEKVEYVKNRRSGVAFAIVVFALPLLCAIITYLIAQMLTDDPGVSGRFAVILFVVAMMAAGVYSYMASKRRCDYMISAICDEEQITNES